MQWFTSRQSRKLWKAVAHAYSEPGASREGLEKDGQVNGGPSQGIGSDPTPDIKGPTVSKQYSPADIAWQKYFDDYNKAHPGYYPNAYEKESFVAGYNAGAVTVQGGVNRDYTEDDMADFVIKKFEKAFYSEAMGKKLKQIMQEDWEKMGGVGLVPFFVQVSQYVCPVCNYKFNPEFVLVEKSDKP